MVGAAAAGGSRRPEQEPVQKRRRGRLADPGSSAGPGAIGAAAASLLRPGRSVLPRQAGMRRSLPWECGDAGGQAVGNSSAWVEAGLPRNARRDPSSPSLPPTSPPALVLPLRGGGEHASGAGPRESTLLKGLGAGGGVRPWTARSSSSASSSFSSCGSSSSSSSSSVSAFPCLLLLLPVSPSPTPFVVVVDVVVVVVVDIGAHIRTVYPGCR
jgi:hypothetical protein